MMTPEMKAYCSKICKERGITKKSITKETLGEIMSEALRRMDKAILGYNGYCNTPQAQQTMARLIYGEIIFRQGVAS
jgi:hypothetical protein